MKYNRLYTILYKLYRSFVPTAKEEGVSFIIHSEKIQFDVGKGSYGKLHVFAYQPGGMVSIGNYTSISEITVIMGGNHHRGITNYPFKVLRKKKEIKEDNESIKGITIGHDCWIGLGATILDGVKIGTGSIVGAGALVSKDIPPYAIAVGNPIRVIKYRFNESDIEKLMKSEWWNLDEQKIENVVDLLYSSDIDSFLKAIR